MKTRIFFMIMLGFLFSLSTPGQKLDMEKLKDLKFRSIGPAGMSGRVTAIDVNLKNPSIMFVGTASGGLWRSKDAGTSWHPVFDKERTLGIGSVAIDQNNPDIVWVGTGEGNPRNSNNGGYGIYRSLDGGDTWTLMGLEKTRHIYRIIVSPENSDEVYAGAIGSPWGPQKERGLYKTTDGGKTWKNILFVNELTGVADMVMDPSNPRKLFVAMWEHQRWPWFFKSGGPGSGLYVTYDAGENWKRLTDKDGLPKGELGRIGLAISRSHPDYVYALIESEKNGLYRSEDGGKTWKLRGTKNIGDRPFYYADIFTDPVNENRVYTLFSRVNVSEDGGRTFQPLISRKIHPDHHAWWISPVDPDFMIDGNDGGMAITHDRGKTWRYVENLPVGQFYHISVDMDLPYHVFGGMQDNGSWRGPAYVWSYGGIINTYWDNLWGGDGFDVLPDPSDLRYCYAMSQQGYVGRIDLETGYSRSIRPVHPEGKKLRFNWNAAIAADPFDKNAIYFGSQFLHKSPDHGNTWTIISPDLTTNDPEKQKQLESGGLTYDVTGAENFTTIICIAPSPVQQGVIWVGTDDGNLQLTQDGGITWKNLNKGLKDIPLGSWIPQITASKYHAGEAFVVVNNYRRHDYAPYLYHTTNFGKTWERMVDENDVFGYVLSFVQDPVEPRLMFLGTENGLYVSIDAGKNWTHWTNGYPAGVSTMDMVIHPREYDLVVATFGRDVYILDDIRPLRKLASKDNKVMDETVHIFNPPVAYEVASKSPPGLFSGGDAYFTGQNRPMGAMITYSVKEGNKDIPSQGSGGFSMRAMMYGFGGGGEGMNSEFAKAKKAVIKVIDEKGDTVRTITQVPKSGINRFIWGLDKKGYRYPGSSRPKPGSPERGGGGYVLPGTYKLVITYEGKSDSTSITVKSDPRLNVSAETLKANQATVEPVMKKMEVLAEAMNRIKESKTVMQSVKKMMPKEKSDAVKKLKEVSKEVNDSLTAISAILFPKENVQGIYRDPKVITSKLRGVRPVMYEIEPLNATQKLQLKQTEELIDKTVKRINTFFDTQWKTYRNAVEAVNITPFKDYKPLKL
ncbi:MAG: hypothetical protein GXO83_07440 [Chlorobi bacterium]|nr:hypothetical protein [Chlorobiota bacterium]